MRSSSTPWGPPEDLKPSIFTPICHPMYPQIATETDKYFLENWQFPNETRREKFLQANFSRFACLSYPLARDDRIGFACRMITILFLIDDEIDHMSLIDAKPYNENLIRIARGVQQPDRNVPVEWMMWDLWEDMRACDKVAAAKVEEPCFLFMRAQVDKTRLNLGGLDGYFEFREKDIGTAIVCAIMTFSMGLDVSKEELFLARLVDSNFAKHLLCINDIYSFEKEIRVQNEGKHEGGIIVSAVPIVAELAKVKPESAKRILWTMCREWEMNHHHLVSEILEKCPSKSLETYLKSMEYSYSGNELWSHETGRYRCK